MSNIATGPIGLYHIMVGENSAMIMRLDDEDGETTLCLIFSRVSGRSFLKQCLRDGIYRKVDFENFEKTWELYNIPDFHYEEEAVIDGHAAELLCVFLGVYVDLVDAEYDFKEIYNLFKEEKYSQYFVPFQYRDCQDAYAPKDMSALMVSPEACTVKYYFDKRDAMALRDLYDGKAYKKQTRKAVLHSSLPYQSIEPVRTYTGIMGELIAYLFWMDQEFG